MYMGVTRKMVPDVLKMNFKLLIIDWLRELIFLSDRSEKSDFSIRCGICRSEMIQILNGVRRNRN